MTKVFCVLENGGVVRVKLEADWTTAELGVAIKQLAQHTLAPYDALLLTLCLAKKGNEWLKSSDAEFALLGNGFRDESVAAILDNPKNVMDPFKLLTDFKFPDGNTGATEVHVLVRTPDNLGIAPAPPPASAVAAQTTTTSPAFQESKEEDPLLGQRVDRPQRASMFCGLVALTKENGTKLAGLVFFYTLFFAAVAIGCRIFVAVAPDQEKRVAGIVKEVVDFVSGCGFHILRAALDYFRTRLVEEGGH